MTQMEQADQMLRDARRTADRWELESLFGRFQYYRSLVQGSRMMELFSAEKADVRIDLGNGVIEGQEDLRAFLTSQKPHRGEMHGRTLINPLVEVAEDRATAKGLFVAAGHDTFVSYEKPDFKEYPFASYMHKDPEYPLYKMTHWVWYKFGVDFIRENGEWKLWHVRRVEIMRCPYDEDWIDFSITRQKYEILNKFRTPWQGLTRETCGPLNFVPTRPSPEPWEGYTITRPVPDNPRMPEPYATFAETFEY